MNKGPPLLSLLFFYCLVLGLLSLGSPSPTNKIAFRVQERITYHYVIQSFNVRFRFMKIRKRAVYVCPRLEEKFDSIRRIPPPGNTPKQASIKKFFQPKEKVQSRLESRRPKRRLSNSRPLHIMQFNVQKSLTEFKAQEVAHYASANGIDVLCLSEIGHRRTIPYFRTAMASDMGTQSGIFVHQDLQATQHKRSFEIQVFERLGILTQMTEIEAQFCICHVYIPPSKTKEEREKYWMVLEQELKNYCRKKGGDFPVLITGDINTKDPVFCENHYEDHQYLSDFLERGNWNVLNDGTATRGPNALDVSIANDLFMQNFIHWEVVAEELDSDHSPTITQTSFCGPPRTQAETFSIPDWTASCKALEREIQKKTPGNLTLYDFTEIASKCIKKKMVRTIASPFWNDTLQKAKKSRNNCKRRWLKTPLNERLRSIYCNARSRFRKLLRQNQKQHRISEVHAAAKDPSGKKGYEILKALAPQTRKRKKNWSTPTEIAVVENEAIAQAIDNISNGPELQMNEEDVIRHQTLLTALDSLPSGWEPISERELLSCIHSAKTSSTPGKDGITNKYIKTMVENPVIRQSLLKALNQELNQSSFPQTLKLAKIIPLPKDKPGEFRPISLLPVTGKILERIVERRIREALQNKFHRAQHGCTPGHGTGPALARLLHASGVAASQGKQFGFISFDFTKAYDRVPHNLLIQKLAELGVPPYLVKFCEAWLCNREFVVAHRGLESSRHKMAHGIPQGSSLSVILWLIYINDIPFSPSECNTYVDDTLVWATADTKEELLQKLTRLGNTMSRWCQVNKVKFNYDKTAFMLNEFDPDDRIIIQGTTFFSARILKYLGVIFRSSVEQNAGTFEIDLSSISNDIKRRCSILKALRKYEMPQALMETFYQGFVGGKIRYYTPWLGAEFHSNTFGKVCTAINTGQRLLLQACPSTPIPLLYGATRNPTISTTIEIDATNMVLSAIARDTILGQEYLEWNGEGDGWSPLGASWKVLREIAFEQDSISPQVRLNRSELDSLANCRFKILQDRNEAIEANRTGKLLEPSDLNLWADGSFDPTTGEGGFAVAIDDRFGNLLALGTKRTTGLSSSYEAEREALALGLEKLNEPDFAQADSISIYSDSQSLLKQLAGLVLQPKYVDEPIAVISRQLGELAAHYSVSLIWIPRGQNIGKHDTVDILANQARRNDCPTEDMAPPPPRLANYHQRLRSYGQDQLDDYLRQNVKESSLCESYPRRTPFAGEHRLTARGKYELWYPYKKRDERHPALFRLRTGHTFTPSHLLRVGIATDSKCLHCKKKVGTPSHVLLKCRALDSELGAIRDEFHRITSGHPLHLAVWDYPDACRLLLDTAKKRGIRL